MGAILPILRKYVAGKATIRDIFEHDDSGLLHKIISENPLYNTQLILQFRSDEECLEKIGIAGEDSWFARVVFNGNYEFIDSYTASEDFDYSNHIYYFNDENKEKLSQIYRYLMNQELETASESKMAEFNKKLESLYRRDYEDLMVSYIQMKNNTIQKSIEEEMVKDLDEYLSEHGFKLYTKFDAISTTISNLVSYISRYGLVDFDLEELVHYIFRSKNKGETDFRWQEDVYQYDNVSEDEIERFNDSVESNLDDILDKIKENHADGVAPYEDFIKLYDRINEKFNFNKSYLLPKSKKYNFIIKGISQDLKIKVILQKGLQHRDISLTEENFYNLLYQPELFNLDYI